jgi:colanic acid biosynthesis glycosyl transferase WcaI
LNTSPQQVAAATSLQAAAGQRAGASRGSLLFLNRVYPPADGATGQLLAELAPELVHSGWQVTVLTSRPGGETPRAEMIAGVRVERVSGLPLTRASLRRRALSYLSLYPALLLRALRLPRADVVVTLTDPPLLAVLGPALKWLKGSRLVHWAQDLYPEVAEALGVLRPGGVLARLCRGLSTWALRQHDVIIAVGRCMKQRLCARGLAPERVWVIPNWAPATVQAADPSAGQTFRKQHGLEDRFVVMYSGNLGLAHPFEAVLDAAQLLRDLRPQIVFVVIGSGPRLAWVQHQAAARQLTNVRFLPPQPREDLAASLGAADLHLVTMHPALTGLVVPSKVYGALAAGRPCLFLGPAESEVAQLIQQFNCGEVLPAATGAVLADRILAWANAPARRQAVARQARAAAQTSQLSTAVAAFLSVFNTLQHQAAYAEPSNLGVCRRCPREALNATTGATGSEQGVCSLRS